MYLYDDPTVTASLPASTGEGTPGYFTDGNPAGGQAATILRAEFMNMLMMELVNAITGAGIPLSKSTFTQLKSAIEAYITARTATETAAGIVELATSAETQTGTDTTRAVTPAGLSARTATETRTGVVELATSAETQTGTDTTRAVTPAGLAGLARSSVASGGYSYEANGDLVQWGIVADTAATFSFPVTFYSVFGIVATPIADNYTASQEGVAGYIVNTSTFRVRHGSQSTSTMEIFYVARGRWRA